MVELGRSSPLILDRPLSLFPNGQLLGVCGTKFKEILHTPSPKFRVKFSRGVYLLHGKQIRSSDFAQEVNLSRRENADNAKAMFV